MSKDPASPATLLWLRRDLRLDDHPALAAAIARGGPVIPVFILDPETEALGAAHRWRLEQALRAFAQALKPLGARLILRRGPALAALRALIEETGARAVHWSRLHDRAARARDEAAKAALKTDGVAAQSFPGALLHEPWTVETGQGGPYKVYTPYWRAIAERPVETPLPAPEAWPSPRGWPGSERLEDWRMSGDMRQGAEVLDLRVEPGESAALARLSSFLNGALADYAERRDRPDLAATSDLSHHLAVGEISPRRIWHETERRRDAHPEATTKFLQELAWRDFAYHLLHHFPQMDRRTWRDGWEDFPWRADNDDAEAWRRGRTGIEPVDAAMRELYVTGRMHNRMRMVTASFLTKHLMTDWRVGEAWFADTLIDWDPASNALGWQWVAGCGPDAAPFFRVFNPQTQGEKFDPDRRYRDRFLAEGRDSPSNDARAFFQAAPRAWKLSPDMDPPRPLVDLKVGRQRALDAYARLRGKN